MQLVYSTAAANWAITAFLCEHVHVFAQNTKLMFCFKNCINFIFSLYEFDKKLNEYEI